MVESGAKEVSEGKMVEALAFGHQAIQPFIDLQEQMAAQIGKPKRAYTSFVARCDTDKRPSSNARRLS